ncbi:MAG: CAP domain-containing protein [Bacteroidales bacterium]
MIKYIILILAIYGFTVHSINAQDKIDKELVVKLMNELRSEACKCGTDKMPAVEQVVWDDSLVEVARYQSDYMAEINTLSHEGRNGTTPAQRAELFDYKYLSIGENVAKGNLSIPAVIDAWRNSPGHCKNMMDSRFNSIDVSRTGDYWTMVLAKPYNPDTSSDIDYMAIEGLFKKLGKTELQNSAVINEVAAQCLQHDSEKQAERSIVDKALQDAGYGKYKTVLIYFGKGDYDPDKLIEQFNSEWNFKNNLPKTSISNFGIANLGKSWLIILVG